MRSSSLYLTRISTHLQHSVQPATLGHRLPSPVLTLGSSRCRLMNSNNRSVSYFSTSGRSDPTQGASSASKTAYEKQNPTEQTHPPAPGLGSNTTTKLSESGAGNKTSSSGGSYSSGIGPSSESGSAGHKIDSKTFNSKQNLDSNPKGLSGSDNNIRTNSSTKNSEDRSSNNISNDATAGKNKPMGSSDSDIGNIDSGIKDKSKYTDSKKRSFSTTTNRTSSTSSTSKDSHPTNEERQGKSNSSNTTVAGRKREQEAGQPPAAEKQEREKSNQMRQNSSSHSDPNLAHRSAPDAHERPQGSASEEVVAADRSVHDPLPKEKNAKPGQGQASSSAAPRASTRSA